MVDSAWQDNTLKAYDAIGPLYAEYSERYRSYLNSVDELVIERLNGKSRLLDLGSGDGRRLKKITDSRAFASVIAVEPSPNMAALCRRATGFDVHELTGNRLAELAESAFDAIISLWNVFGHMSNRSDRLASLVAMREKLAPAGIIILDVNNRHNAAAYGRWKILGRRVIDAVAFDERRGDVHFEWQIAGQSFPTFGHLFTPTEIETLFREAGLTIIERYSINYRTGEKSLSPFEGQLFYVLSSASS